VVIRCFMERDLFCRRLGSVIICTRHAAAGLRYACLPAVANEPIATAFPHRLPAQFLTEDPPHHQETPFIGRAYAPLE
jgi:hypothetical protein